MSRAASDPAAATIALAHAATGHALAYPYRRWGFGEDIALRALLNVGEVTGDGKPAAFVARLVGEWSLAVAEGARGAPGAFTLPPADHVAPGVALLALYERGGEGHLLDAALALGRLLLGFPRVDGVAVHRGDLEGWRSQVWVDCMALDGPFLARLGRVTGDAAWTRAAVDALLAYARVLREPATGLLVHGFDVAKRQASHHPWARGNGWALHGLVDTLAELPSGEPCRDELERLLADLLDALARRQHPSGLWTTILNDPESPLEHSTPALFASAARKALRLRLVAAEARDRIGAMADRAHEALLRVVDPQGALHVSSATPIGDRATYVERPTGVFPWGQGPLLLTLIEAHRATHHPQHREDHP